MTAVRIFAAAVLLLLGCRFDDAGINIDAEAGPCPGHTCQCIDADTCAPTCGFDGCLLTCQRLDLCQPSCGDDCQTHADSAQRVELTCGDGCQADFAAIGEVDVDCGRDCSIACTDVGTCRVTLRSGEVRCERTGVCDVACETVEGVPREAELGEDGRRTCVEQITPG